MKRWVWLLALTLVWGDWVAALDEKGALGLGLTVQTNQSDTLSNNLRLNCFLDAGGKLVGPVSFGFEMAGDLAILDQQSFHLTQTDLVTYNIGHYGQWASYYNANAQATYTLWDADLSPRIYLSYDWRRVFQALGFVGLDYNWQSLDYTLKNTGTTTWTATDGSTLAPGQSVATTSALPGNLYGAVGFRLSIGLGYLDYTRLISLTNVAIDLDNYDVNRIDAGISLRF